MLTINIGVSYRKIVYVKSRVAMALAIRALDPFQYVAFQIQGKE